MTESWLDGLNSGADDERLAKELSACCSSQQWVGEILRQRPDAGTDAVRAASDVAVAALDEAGLADALAGHPRIGDRPAGVDGEWSRQEQAGVAAAGSAVLAEVATANADYERRFGQVYLVCATGKSADELLAICRSRLANDPDTEERVVRAELAKITGIRLGKLLHSYDAP
jgi:2-oxo-4-hydroxy-4-carboxy-5-ureidoimidazoline decarboxylase